MLTVGVPRKASRGIARGEDTRERCDGAGVAHLDRGFVEVEGAEELVDDVRYHRHLCTTTISVYILLELALA